MLIVTYCKIISAVQNIKNEPLEVFSKAEQAPEALTTISSARYFFVLSSLVDENRIYPFKGVYLDVSESCFFLQKKTTSINRM